MPEQPLWPSGGEAADAERSGTAALAQAALTSPTPAPEAEREARERALAQFQEMPPPTRTLRPQGTTDAGIGWIARLWQRLRRK